MEMEFDRIPVAYLQKLTDSARSQEETLELRLPDSMPDIGRVLGAWGQVIIRGKEWDTDNMAVSCGVMAWVLYTPEGEEGVRSVEAWLPFSMKWDLPQTRHDGKITVSCKLKSVDARSISARKLMVRAALCADAIGWQAEQAQIAMPGELPEDVQLLRAEYPVMLPREAGEKAFFLEEQLAVSDTVTPEKLLYYTLQPEITDKKLMAGKVVFRGNGAIHLLYRGEDGRVYSWDGDLPFSQYADLDGEYDSDGTVGIEPCVTSLDVSMNEEGQLLIKAGLLGQYTVADRSMVAVGEDVYSPNRRVEGVYEQLRLPAILDRLSNALQAEKTLREDVAQVADIVCYPACGQTERRDGDVGVFVPGQFQMLYYDAAGELRSMLAPYQAQWHIQTAEDSAVNVSVAPAGRPQATVGADNVTLRADMTVDATVSSGQGMPMLIGLEMGETEKPDPNRPSLILCRKGNRRLWDVAKQTGSTVETIMGANGLDGEPESGHLLLIPVK